MTTAASQQLSGCRHCAAVQPEGESRCHRCGLPLHAYSSQALWPAWAWLAAGAALFIPANLLPMLETRTFLHARASTIVGGAWELAQAGSVLLAAVIVIFSIVVPLGKFAVLAALLGGLRRGRVSPWLRRRGHVFVEYIGRWSMIDVFIVALLSTLVQFNLIAAVRPGPAALAFALSVICTMRAAQLVDPRALWNSRPDPGW